MSTRDDGQTFAPMPGSRCAKCHAYADEHAYAESRVADLEAGIRALIDEGDSERETYFAGFVDTAALRALVGVEAPGTGEHA